MTSETTGPLEPTVTHMSVDILGEDLAPEPELPADRNPMCVYLARLAVGKAIRRTLTQITHADPHVGEHLRNGIHTGTRCSYRPAQPAAP